VPVTIEREKSQKVELTRRHRQRLITNVKVSIWSELLLVEIHAVDKFYSRFAFHVEIYVSIVALLLLLRFFK
jgi:hypothetical protein